MSGDPPDPVAPPGGYGTTPYLGNVKAKPTQKPVKKGKNAGVEPVPVVSRGTVKSPFGPMTVNREAYKKGDQVALLPKNGQALKNLQYGLYEAGYLTDEQFKKIVPGSPDDLTTAAFAKLLATSNMSGVNWQQTLSDRVAAKGAMAPEEADQNPPLTVSLTDPAAIKQTLNVTARKLLGAYMTPEQTDAFVAQFQAQQTAQQTAQYGQQYDPAGGYGPGGTTMTPDLEAQAEVYAKTTDPNQYKATQFGSQVHEALNSLRSTGYLG